MAGAAAGGAQGCVGGGGTVTMFRFPVRADYLLSSLCATKKFSGMRCALVVKKTAISDHSMKNRKYSKCNFDSIEYLLPKCGRTQPFLTGFNVRGDALKGCSGGDWRSGRRRSGKCWRRGHGHNFNVPCMPVSC